nr:NAD(P)/FAD-dependent oxidoreductase [Luteimonas sp. BDR2-5]
MLVNKPVVVVGAGLAGLSAANALARAGHRVVLAEAGDAHGGCCSTTAVDGFTFNNGAVYVAVPSLLRRGFARLGLDLDAELRLVAIADPIESHLEDGSVVHLASADTAWVDGPRAQSRTEILQHGLARLRRQWGPVYRTLVEDVLPHEPTLWRALLRLGRYLPRMRGHVDSLIEDCFPDPGVQAAVSAVLLYSGIAPERLPATQIIGLMALLEEGFHLPEGGMGAVTDALFRYLPRPDVDVRLGQAVRRIDVAGGRVRGVLLADGERIETQHVLATTSGFDVVRNLLPPGSIPRRLARICRDAPLSHRAVSIQLGCSGVAAPGAFIVNHVPAMAHQWRMHRRPSSAPDWLSWTVPTRVLPTLAGAGKSIVELYAPATGIDTAADWSPDMTDSAVRLHVEALRRRMPGLDIETMRVVDPRAFAGPRHLYEGALYGIAPGTAPNRLFPHRSGIPGLYLAGQTTFPGYGVSTAVWSGLQAVDAMLQDDRRRG